MVNNNMKGYEGLFMHESLPVFFFFNFIFSFLSWSSN